MKKLKGLLILFLHNSKLRIAKSMAYRADFVSGLFISIIYALIGPVTQFLIFTQTKGYPGWTIYQVMLFQGVLLLFTGIRNMFFGDIRTIIVNIIRKGDFDRYLLKPYPSIGVILTSCFSFNNIGTVIAGTVISLYYMVFLKIHITFVSIILILVSFVFAMLFFMALLVTFCGFIIVLVQMPRIWDLLDALLKYAEYPIQIFPKVLQVFFLIIFPFAVFVYFPTQVLLSRLDIIAFVGLISCALLFYLSLKFWNFCIKRYTSAGG